MKRKQIEITDPFANVKMVPLIMQSGQSSSKSAVLLASENKEEEVGVVSNDYRLIPNLEVKNIALDILTRMNLPFEERQMIFDGRRYLQRWTIPEYELEPIPGDVIRLGLQVYNSYDGSSLFGLSFVAERLICSNGMVVDFLLGGFRFRHYGNEGAFTVEIDQALETIFQLGERGKTLMPAINRMINTSVDRQSIQDRFNDLKLPQTYIAKVFMTMDEDNEWSLYNACTEVFTALVSFRGEMLNRQVSHYFFVQRQR